MLARKSKKKKHFWPSLARGSRSGPNYSTHVRPATSLLARGPYFADPVVKYYQIVLLELSYLLIGMMIWRRILALCKSPLPCYGDLGWLKTNCSETALKLHWNCFKLDEIHLYSTYINSFMWKLMANCSETALKLLWNCLKLDEIPCNCNSIVLMWKLMEITENGSTRSSTGIPATEIPAPCGWWISYSVVSFAHVEPPALPGGQREHNNAHQKLVKLVKKARYLKY